MNGEPSLSKRAFSPVDQEAFARLSGDRNPMHMDALYARRTQAGAPVVHGMHLLLGALEALSASLPPEATIRSVQAKFAKFVYVGEEVETIRSGTGDKLRLELSVGGATRAQAIVHLGAPATAGMASFPGALASGTEPLALGLDDLDGLAGGLDLEPSLGPCRAAFPSLCARIGAERVAAVAGTSRIVGMLAPGLHSIYAEATFNLVEDGETRATLAYRVDDVDRRFRLARIAAEGSGIRGALKTFVRMPPVAQASTSDLRGLVAPSEFAGSVVLVVGGSRGLGELTAKLIALGGGQVVLTYRSGQADADAVAADIRRSGGQATVVRYDAAEDPDAQLAGLPAAPTHAYYFATPAIFKQQSEFLSPARLDEMMGVYVGAFWGLVAALRRRNPEVSLYYPSSVALDERPRGMTEYAMAKAAGEALCADLNEALAPTHVAVTRLPRLLTDQTATVTAVETPSAVDVMLPIVREVQSWPRR